MIDLDTFLPLKEYFKILVPTLSEQSWEITAQVLTTRHIKKGEYLTREGQICNYVSFVNKGLVRMYYIVNGREKVICFENEIGYISDYQSFLSRTPSGMFIQALENTELFEISYPDLQKLYQLVPEANLIGRMICENMFLMMARMSHLEIKETIAQRYRRLITEMPWLMQRVPQYMIASYLGITPEALSRIKSKIRHVKQVGTLIS